MSSCEAKQKAYQNDVNRHFCRMYIAVAITIATATQDKLRRDRLPCSLCKTRSPKGSGDVGVYDGGISPVSKWLPEESIVRSLGKTEATESWATESSAKDACAQLPRHLPRHSVISCSEPHLLVIVLTDFVRAGGEAPLLCRHKHCIDFLVVRRPR